jgi:hypothetical protein
VINLLPVFCLGVSRVFSLSIHAGYRCRHSGVCCSSDWDVPVDVPVYRSLDEAMRVGTLAAAGRPHDDAAVLIADDDLPEDAAAMVARTASGHCVFYHRPSGLCVVHRDLGQQSLPVTCRHFPRLAVRDGRGTSISLTHYCPTAASMLFRDVPIEIVADPEAFPPGDYEGLIVAADAWPPLLNPTMLMDLASYGAWERHMVRRCANEGAMPEGVVATLSRDAEALQDFDPARERLLDRIEHLPADGVPAGAPSTLASSLDHFALVVAAVHDDLKPGPDEEGLEPAYAALVRPVWGQWHAPLRRYLAAKAFANWTAYQGRGVRAIVQGLDAALALVRVEASRRCRDRGRLLDEEQLREAIRGADFALNHLAGGDELADAWSRACETQVGANPVGGQSR